MCTVKYVSVKDPKCFSDVNPPKFVGSSINKYIFNTVICWFSLNIMLYYAFISITVGSRTGCNLKLFKCVVSIL